MISGDKSGRQVLSSIFFLGANALLFLGYYLLEAPLRQEEKQYDKIHYHYLGIQLRFVGFALMIPHVALEGYFDLGGSSRRQNNCSNNQQPDHIRQVFRLRYRGGVRLINLLQSVLVFDATLLSCIGVLVHNLPSVELIAGVLWLVSGIMTLYNTSLRQHDLLDVLGNIIYALGSIKMIWCAISVNKSPTSANTNTIFVDAMLSQVYLIWVASGVFYVIADLKRWMKDQRYLPLRATETNG